ncbi:TPA: hypothetical protein MH715_26890 [Klebsiella pneumoniae]|uniref:Uncharacterized protein n=3 Tax=Enterobacteriaceae TaxID=543 RepID=A0A3A3EJQ2_ECOLX|nr:hypothetical protein BUE82_26435 [Escherichia coli]EBC7156018.1 hypothetical protein [Salmonella enterica]EBL5463003.1 hypothetical protein [Salmonella enterica subsp. enterica serovar Kentucky]EBV1943353.1 hypothetical protein [Salmonella enterica subsp. enterica serovar Braenderup]ECU2315570.1 hypothetical protein [Salmonella enterica subsp. enterica serovar Infantis]EFN7271546.1 hypothetical protein [Escherichia coli O21]TBI38003.1 hypothetical protein EY746_21190 [Salmonella enterica s
MRISAGNNRTGMNSTGHFYREERTAEGGGRQVQKNRLVRPVFLRFRGGVGGSDRRKSLFS